MMRNMNDIKNRLALVGTTLTLALGTSASATVVISDGFGDGDRNNDGSLTFLDWDVNASGVIDSYEAPVYPGSNINEISAAEDPGDTGITWTGIRGFTSSPNANTGVFDEKFFLRVVDDSAGLSPEGVAIDSGYALSMNSKGRGASAAGFFGQNVALGPNDGDQVKVSFDFRLWDASPNLNTDGTPTTQLGDLRWGIFQDTDNQLGQTNPFGGQPDPNTGIPGPGVWGQDDGQFRGDLGSIGANGDAGWYTRIKLMADADPDGADDPISGTGPRIYEETNTDPGGTSPTSKRIMEGSDNDFVASPDDLDPQFTSLIYGKVYNLALTLERAGSSILATYTVNNLTDGTSVSFGGTESLTDGSLPGSGGIQSDSWDYIAIRNSSASSFNEDDYDMMIDNLLVETFDAASELEGDLNGDGFVGVDDLNIVLVNWNQNVTPGDKSQGDPTGEGFVGVDDLNIVLVNWNNGTPPAGAAVPEPASLALLGLGGLAVLKRRR